MDVDRTAAPEQGAVVYITHKTKSAPAAPRPPPAPADPPSTVTAVHRLWSNTLSEVRYRILPARAVEAQRAEELGADVVPFQHNNSQRYGSAINVHGHEYTFKVTFRGVVRKNRRVDYRGKAGKGADPRLLLHSGTVTGPTELLEEVVALSIGEILDR